MTNVKVILVVIPFFFNSVSMRNFDRLLEETLPSNQDLAPSIGTALSDLGAAISHHVNQSLKPIRKMQFTSQIKNGIDGVTIATFKDKRFIIRDGIFHECHGTISEQDGSCSSELSEAKFKKKEDFCYANINAAVNNWYCIGIGQVTFRYVNGIASCKSSDGPTLSISDKDYKKLCRKKSSTVTYKYFTNEPLGEHGSEIRCSGDQPHVCILTQHGNPNVGHSGVSVFQNIQNSVGKK